MVQILQGGILQEQAPTVSCLIKSCRLYLQNIIKVNKNFYHAMLSYENNCAVHTLQDLFAVAHCMAQHLCRSPMEKKDNQHLCPPSYLAVLKKYNWAFSTSPDLILRPQIHL